MNWNNNNGLLKILIGVLLVVNIATITIIWVFIINDRKPRFRDEMGPPPEAVELFQKEFGFTKEQSAKFEEMRKELFSKSDSLFKVLNETRNLLAENLYTANGSAITADSVFSRIAMLQSELERERYIHFQKVLSICNEEQKEKFKPVLKRMLNPGLHGMRPGGPGIPRPGELPPAMF